MLSEVQPLSRIPENGLRTIGYVLRVLGIAGAVGTMLALSGIYAVMSFAVSRRTREIGIRVALGSSRSRVVFTILRKPLMQVAMGSVLGPILFLMIPIVLRLDDGALLSTVTPAYVMGMAGYTVLMFGVCMLACLVPARRVLRVDPIAALRSD
jgi:ABC-type antimicrobial peptide transport system permease subunit